VINISTPTPEATLGEAVAARPVSRIGSRTFWALIGLELVVLFAALIWAIGWMMPSAATPFASAYDLSPVQEAIWARMSGEVVDPIIEVQPGVTARESNIRGFRLAERTYYYYIVGAQNFDPLSLGRVKSEQVEVLFRDESGPQPVVIYTIAPSGDKFR
jgi:hypothetical protein